MSIASLLFLVLFMYSVNADATTDVKNEVVSLTNLPEKMAEFGKFLQGLQKRMKKADGANPSIALIMRKTMLNEIEERQAEIDQVDILIREVFESGTISREDRVELELHLYNIDTFRQLADSVTKQLKRKLN